MLFERGGGGSWVFNILAGEWALIRGKVIIRVWALIRGNTVHAVQSMLMK